VETEGARDLLILLESDIVQENGIMIQEKGMIDTVTGSLTVEMTEKSVVTRRTGVKRMVCTLLLQ
jgi:hypothetical protein